MKSKTFSGDLDYYNAECLKESLNRVILEATLENVPASEIDIELDGNNGYGHTLSYYYSRPMTQQEIEEEQAKEDARNKKREEHERKMYEKLKARFG